MNSPLPRSIVYPLYQILCTDTNEILLTEVCRTLCSLWSESHPISTTSLNLNDLELAWNLFLKQIHSEDLKCVSHGNLRSWLNFVGYLTSLQHKFLALSSQITSAPCRTPSFLSSEDLDWFSDSILQLMCITKLTDIFGCTETYSKPLQVAISYSIFTFLV